MGLNMKVSIIMPVYNADKFVYEAIDSILKQTYTNFELLVFNDGSTDKSLEIIQSFKDDRIQLFNYEQNIGYVQHLNMGILEAKSELIARMDADDISLPNRLEEQVKYMTENPEVGLCGTMCNIIGKEDEIIDHLLTHHEIVSELFWKNSFIHSTIMMRKSTLEKYNINYDISFRPSEDYLLFTKMAMVSKVVNIDKVLVSYRFHENQVTITENRDSLRNAQRVRYYLITNFLGVDMSENDKMILTHVMNGFNPNINPLELIEFLDRITTTKVEIDSELKALIINRFNLVKIREIKRIYLWEFKKNNNKTKCLKLIFTKEIGCYLSVRQKLSIIKNFLYEN